MRREVAMTQSHAEEMKNPVKCIDPRAKLPRVPLISVISGVPVEYQKAVVKILKRFPINRFIGDSNDYACVLPVILNLPRRGNPFYHM